MNAPAKSTEKTILLSLADKLTEAQGELDELTLQLALGKAEVRDKFEEIKKEFRSRLTNFRHALKSREQVDIYKEIITRLDQLERRLNAGMVEDKGMFVAQKRLIMKSLLALQMEVKKRLPEHIDVTHFMNEIENFKLKLEILRLRFVLKRFTIKDDIKSNVAAVRMRVSIVLDKARKQLAKGEKKFILLNKDLTKALT